MLGLLLLPHDKVSALTFTASGDYSTTSKTNAVIDQIGEEAPDFHLALGDLSYGSNSDVNQEANWCSYANGRLSGQGINTGTFPFQLLAGNHEDDERENGFIDDFTACMPDRMSSSGSYADHYYFDQDNVRVIMISPSLAVNGNSYDFETSSQEYQDVSDWIDDGRTGGADWIIVGIHRNCLTVGDKPTCEIGTDVMNLLMEKNVDLILHAHDHTYQRTKQLKLGAGCSTLTAGGYDTDCVNAARPSNVYTKGSGPVDIVTGAGGHSLYDINYSDSERSYFLRASGQETSPSYGNLVVDISGNELTAQFKAAVGAYSDKFIITDSGEHLVNEFDTTTNLTGDFNGDGRDDLAYAQKSGDTTSWRVAKSNGSGFGASSVWKGDFGNANDSVYVGDFNGDNKDDIAYRRMSGDTATWSVAKSTGKSFGASSIWSNDFGNANDAFYVGDFTGNGQDDIAYSRASGDTIAWYIAKSQGGSFGSDVLWASDIGNAGDEFFVGKFNKDSKADIAVMRPSSGTTIAWYVALSGGSYFNNESLWSSGTGDADDMFKVGDYNNDGRDDLAYIRLNNFYTLETRRALSNGSSFGSSSTWKTDIGNDGDRFRVGDFNGDNRDDIALARGTSTSTLLWKVGLSKTSGLKDATTWKSDFGSSTDLF